MDELENGLQDPQTPDEEELGLLAEPEAIQDARVQELIEKNKRLFERAKKAEEQNKKFREKSVAQPNSPSSSVPQAPTNEIESVLQLQAEGYSNTEILKIREYSRRMKMPIEEVIKDSLIKAGIEAERAKARVEQATPPPTTSTIMIEGKSFAEMTPQERKNNFDKVVEKYKR